jgi:predicted alpha/beta-fold hydrolase
MRQTPTTPHADFRPFPLLGNRHVQTLLGHIVRGFVPPLPARLHICRLADGDATVLHDTSPPSWQPGAPIAVLVHGMTGSHASPLIVSLGWSLASVGVRVVRVDLRGAGKSLPLCRRSYHGGISDDLRAALEEIHRWCPHSPLLLAGVSLGGNIALKLAGEAASRPVRGLARVAVLGPPVDLAGCVSLLSEPQNRFYHQQFVRELACDARLRQMLFPDLPPLRLPPRLTMRLFDELYTAPRSGFADAADYYRRASSLPLLPYIELPTLIIAARDDPFVTSEPFDKLSLPPTVELRVVPNGGHLGFLGSDGTGGFRWAEAQIARWLLADVGVQHAS